jgi:hypothetical protein
LNDILPSTVAHSGRQIGGADNVSEKHDCKNPVGFTLVSYPREKFLNFRDEPSAILRKKQMINTRKAFQVRTPFDIVLARLEA